MGEVASVGDGDPFEAQELGQIEKVNHSSTPSSRNNGMTRATAVMFAKIARAR